MYGVLLKTPRRGVRPGESTRMSARRPHVAGLPGYFSANTKYGPLTRLLFSNPGIGEQYSASASVGIPSRRYLKCL